MPIDPSLQTPENYATPQQIASMLEYSKQLLGQTNEPVHSAWQGAANIARALVGGYTGHAADVAQQQGRAQYGKQLQAAMTNSNGIAGAIPAMTSPWATPESNQMLTASLIPKERDVGTGYQFYNPLNPGQPTGFIPKMVHTQQELGGNKLDTFYQGDSASSLHRMPVGAGPSAQPSAPQQPQQAPQPPQSQPPQSPAPQPQGGGNPLSDVTGYQVSDARTGTPIRSGTFNDRFPPNNPISPDQQAMVDWGRQQQAATQGAKTTAEEGAKAKMVPIAEAAKEAKTAPQSLNALQVIEDVAKNYGDKITTGPFADQVQQIKQAVNGLAGSNVLGDTAPGEIIKKMNAQLASAALPAFTNRGTQFDLKVFMENNPGLSTSIQGTLFLTNILKQIYRQNMDLARYASDERNWNNWPAVQEQYYSTHKLINPLTGHELPVMANPNEPKGQVERNTGFPQATKVRRWNPATGGFEDAQ